MKNLIFLSLLFIAVDITGSWIPVYFMNTDQASASLTAEYVSQAIGFRLFFAFWYWIAAYLFWLAINIFVSFALAKSITRSIIVSFIVPLAVLVVVDSIPVLIWYFTLGIFFGLLFHKFVNINQKAVKNSVP